MPPPSPLPTAPAPIGADGGADGGGEGGGGGGDRRGVIAIDLRALVPEATGIGVYTRSLALALAHRGAFRYLGVAHRPPRGAGELVAAGVAVEHQPAPLGVLWQQLVLPRRLARGDVDLLWSPLLTLPLASPVPGVVTLHDLTVLLMPEAHRAKVRLSLLPFLRPSLAGARRIAALSRATADDLAFHFPATVDKTEVVYPGVDAEFRPAPAAAIAAARAELGAPDGYLLSAATLEPRKNLGALLDAWESLAAGDPRFPPLVLAGPYGWGSRALARRIARLAASSTPPAGTAHGDPAASSAATATAAAAATGPRLLVLGRVPRDRLVRLFQAATLFVYPSLYEGFGLPPAEAIACGVPVVALATSSLPEVVGDAGILVEPGDTGALAAALDRLVGDPAHAADLAARALARRDLYTWERSAAGMEELFRAALAG